MRNLIRRWRASEQALTLALQGLKQAIKDYRQAMQEWRKTQEKEP